ncbi:hypothetical protein N8I77_005780 [Diaporthe amygdali]|uniref:VOC domain-containing protein n=1 Tax=Phomopsis amygdali TaxID=1214568 RepID=A0AAD9W338_PHOAM|nr:hypothetical protein N8I77_005780 [Diaporthe amygdali]KAK2607074.1 hypothetical protein N8I77_005780 [Diaporthe amygdali]
MAPQYTIIQPSLPVSSIPDAVAYYTGRLGFRLAGRDGDNHCWVQLVDDDNISKWDAAVNIYLRRRGFPGIENDVQFGKVYIRIDGDDDELEKLRDTLKANKADIIGDIQTKPWGLRDLVVKDPDGNVITFNQRVKDFQRPANTVFEASSKRQD